ncbi:hypothetical protein [Macrococcus carouselicus]|uniref:hypothetical protein n=1 Tax=Macrococcus carouselicus TaxID=69969 RepID=UPI00140D4611|nr:hypothetical protein [Macrococcus carouselicus]
MKRFSYNDGMVFPFALILLMIVIFYVGSFSVRYTVKLNTIENIKNYYYNEIINEMRQT